MKCFEQLEEFELDQEVIEELKTNISNVLDCENLDHPFDRYGCVQCPSCEGEGGYESPYWSYSSDGPSSRLSTCETCDGNKSIDLDDLYIQDLENALREADLFGSIIPKGYVDAYKVGLTYSEKVLAWSRGSGESCISFECYLSDKLDNLPKSFEACKSRELYRLCAYTINSRVKIVCSFEFGIIKEDLIPTLRSDIKDLLNISLNSIEQGYLKN